MGRRGAHRALDTLDLNFVSIWVPAPESNPSDVKGEGTRKNNMEITWTVSVPSPASQAAVHTWVPSPFIPLTPQGSRVAQTAWLVWWPLVCVGRPETKQEHV